MNSLNYYENLKLEIKSELTKYYQNLQYEINIEAQSKLIEYELEKEDDDDFYDNQIYESGLDLTPERLIEKYELFRINKFLIDQVQNIMEKNLSQMDSYFEQNGDSFDKIKDKETIKFNALNNWCTFIGNSVLVRELKFENYAGLFLTYDWYLKPNEMNYIRSRFGVKNRPLFECDKDIITLKYGFDNIDGVEKSRIEINKTSQNIFSFRKSQIDHKLMSINNEIEFKFLTDPTIVENIDLDDANESEQINPNTFDNLNQNLKKFRFILNFTQLNMNDLILQQSLVNKLKCLIELDLSYSQIKRVKSNTFSRLENLEILKFKKCRIKIIEKDSFLNMSKLRELDLGSNRLNKIETSEIFNGLANLKVLSLDASLADNNKSCVKFIADESFKNLSKLELLNLSNNRLQKITVRTFYGLTNLKTIYFGKCRFKSIQDSSFKLLTNLDNLYLTDSNNKFFNYSAHKDFYKNLGLNNKFVLKYKAEYKWYYD